MDYIPDVVEIVDIFDETPTVKTFRLQFVDSKKQDKFSFRSGQFCMAGIPGYGNAPFAYASSPYNKEWFEISVKKVGRLTKKISQLRVGNEMFVRGPYGNFWPIDLMKGEPVFAIAGGMGFPSVRSFLLELKEKKEICGKVTLFYGSSSAEELLYKREIPSYADWCMLSQGVRKSVKPLICKGVEWVVMVGPSIMMKNICKSLADKGFHKDHIYISNERMMKCGVGFCGHCNMGGVLVCKHGPIFSYEQILSSNFYEETF
jgi:NAD(P)H-flavin reductase